MEEKKSAETPQRQPNDYKDLMQTMDFGRLAAQENKAEVTKDEWDRVSVNQLLDLVDTLNRNVFDCLRTVRQAIQSLKRSQERACVSCGKDLIDDCLQGAPWDTMCVHCRLATREDDTPSQM